MAEHPLRKAMFDAEMQLEHDTFCSDKTFAPQGCAGHLPLDHPEYAACTASKIVHWWQDRGRLPVPVVIKHENL